MRFLASLAVCVLFVGLVSVPLVSSLNKTEHCKCRIQTTPRIVGGRVALFNAWPWQASISPGLQGDPKLVPNEQKLRAHVCGGIILNERWILTAASCLQFSMPGTRPTVGFGYDNDLLKIFDGGRIKARQAIPHPKFNPMTVENDIGLLELEKPLEFNSTVLPGCLETRKTRSNYGDQLVVTGFGLTSKIILDPQTGMPVQYGTPSRFLKELDVIDNSENDERCAKFEENVCIDSKSPGMEESICFGDTGGPMHKTVNGKTTILAVASISNQTIINEDQHIVVCNGQAWYTRIGHFIDWIQNYVEDDHC